MSDAPLLFLDANALASPVTRTLLIAGARADGLWWTWSRHVEVEADRHARGQASQTSIVRKKILGTELLPTAQSTEGLATDSAQDRQVVTDAIRAGGRYLITTDVDDFAFDDLAAHGMSAISPDYFMALRFTEELARYRRVPLACDLYDPQWYAAAGAMDQGLVRRLWVLKVYRDIVVDGRGGKPINPADVLGHRVPSGFRSEDIGYLTKPVRIDEWIATVRSRYAFLADLDVSECRWVECNERDLYDVETALTGIRQEGRDV